MNPLRAILRDYLAMRRALGFKLERAGALLPDFLAYLEEEDSPIITTALALSWAKKPAQVKPRWWADRLDLVRHFARYVHTLDPRTEIPPYDLLPRDSKRTPPYVYSDAEVIALMSAADQIQDPFRAHTYKTLIGLLASTGMRVGEAVALDQTDLDLEAKLVTIRTGKFGKSRLIPLHPTAMQALEGYARARVLRFGRRSTTPAFFLSLAGTRLFYNNAHLTFFRLVDRAGLGERKPRRPRIHDLRHTFAIRTLIDWYQAGLDVERQLPVLSTYLGHVHPSSTYWYLSAIPELLDVAAQRLQDSMGELP
jgi:integrase/recombinase XerD